MAADYFFTKTLARDVFITTQSWIRVFDEKQEEGIMTWMNRKHLCYSVTNGRHVQGS